MKENMQDLHITHTYLKQESVKFKKMISQRKSKGQLELFRNENVQVSHSLTVRL